MPYGGAAMYLITVFLTNESAFAKDFTVVDLFTGNEVLGWINRTLQPSERQPCMLNMEDQDSTATMKYMSNFSHKWDEVGFLHNAEEVNLM